MTGDVLRQMIRCISLPAEREKCPVPLAAEKVPRKLQIAEP